MTGSNWDRLRHSTAAVRRPGRPSAGPDPLRRRGAASSSMVVSRATATWPGPASVARRERPHLHPARRGERVRRRRSRRRGRPGRCASSSTGGAPGRARRRRRKSARKRSQGGRRGATPAVDRLVRVADRGDRHRLAGRDEQRSQQLQLGLGGVLELVEQHRPEPRRARPPRPAARRGDPGGERHLVGEVHGVAGPLEVVVAAHEGHDGRPLAQDGDDAAHSGATACGCPPPWGRASSVATTSSRCAASASASTRCSAISPARSTTAVVTVDSAFSTPSIGPSHATTASCANCHAAASVSSRLSGSTPRRSPCSRTIRPAYAW